MEPLERLRELLAPVQLDVFFADFFDRKPLHIRGPADRVRGLLSRKAVVSAIAGEDDPRGRFLLRPGDRARASTRPSTSSDAQDGGSRSSEEAVEEYLAQGNPLLWNGARGATEAMDRLTADLAHAFRAHVWPNVYLTGEAGTAHDTHFDPHDVLVIQVEGTKEWRISAVRINNPLELPALTPTIQRALDLRRAEAQSETLMTFTVEPGDIVYIPRGQFHNARAVGGPSLHVTFAILPPTGIDVLEGLARLAVNESLFRESLPLAVTDPGGARRQEYLVRLGSRISELAASEALGSVLDEITDELIARSHGRREGTPAEG
jgi:ribosomal protein L16 Arg81 hydroxylase